jgi:predicted dehydrogenase
MRAAVIGVGSMGTNHARVYNELDEVELVAVADNFGERAEFVAGRMGTGIRAYDDFLRMLDEQRPDLISIAVPTSEHLRVARAAIERGIHVLVEKPIAANLTEAVEMARLAERHGVVLTVGHIERFNPAIIELQRRLEAGELGRIFEIHARRLGPFPPRIQDVGVIVDLATHDLDVIHKLVDSPATRVYAETDRRIHSAHEDIVMGLIKFANGVLAIIDINWLTPTKIRELIVTGERGMFVASYLTQELRYYQNLHIKDLSSPGALLGVSEGDMITYRLDRCEPLKAELRCFINSVRTGEPPCVTAVDGMSALALAETLIESSRLQLPIRLNGNGYATGGAHGAGAGDAALPIWPYVSNAEGPIVGAVEVPDQVPVEVPVVVPLVPPLGAPAGAT